MHSLNINYVLPTGKYIPTHYFGLHNINGKISINCTKKAWTFLRLAIWSKRTFGYVDYEIRSSKLSILHENKLLQNKKKSIFLLVYKDRFHVNPKCSVIWLN